MSARAASAGAVSLGGAVADAASRLAAAGVDSARLDARLLAGRAFGLAPEAALTDPERPLGGAGLACFDRLVARRAAREPLAHILGQREFWSLPFRVDGATLIPRPDSECVVEAALFELKEAGLGESGLIESGAAPRILDLGTGSGCLLLALLSELPGATGIGVDCSTGALDLAAANARALGLDGRADFYLGHWGRDLGPDFSRVFNCIVINPPYIPDQEIAELAPEIARYEPREALAGGADGLDAYRALAPDLLRLAAPEGLIVVEVGAGQADAVGDILVAAGLGEARVTRDLAGVERCLVATAPRPEKR